ncbi:hypothetical protein QMO56_19720 [Roseomonas sp. E05]|uniref:hypothetical protein n=1 Tax=Roseomonas sp. E05 TaxID=3046310 RepID=UPI0024BAE510|nr:hypothetical protein [Roseomonas sp. E05]MDJ0390345.1 hypothetical protein [Roseomonas sp. E05]
MLFDPAAPGAGAWIAVPLMLLRRLPALRRDGAVAFIGLAEQLAAAADPAARMSLRRAYVPASSLGRIAGGRATLPLCARAVPAPGCSERLRHLPRLDAGAVRFGFRGAQLTLADGRHGWVSSEHERTEDTLRVTVEGAVLDIPLHRFDLLVRDWSGPRAAPRVALQGCAKNS